MANAPRSASPTVIVVMTSIDLQGLQFSLSRMESGVPVVAGQLESRKKKRDSRNRQDTANIIYAREDLAFVKIN